ncbi:MAG: ABC transporter permease [Firmicutes bacterium]|nr:ABC transporter permease [Bacillota bacterium]
MRKYNGLTFKYLKKQKQRTALTLLGIILSVALITSIGIFGESIKHGMVQQVLDLKGKYHGTFDNLDDKEISILKKHTKVKNVGIQTPLGGYRREDSSLTISIEGWDKNLIDMIGRSLLKGRWPRDNNEIVLERWLLEQLEIEPRIGNKFTWKYDMTYIDEEGKWNNYESEAEFTLVGIMKDSPGGKATGSSLSLVSINTVKNLLPKALLNKNAFFWVNDTYSIKDTLDELQSSLKIDDDNVRVNYELLNILGENDKVNFPIIFLIAIVLIATIGAIYNIFHISVMERIKEFGTLRSIGTTPKQIKKMLFTEGFFLSVISIPVGILVGFIFSKLLISNLSIVNNVANEVVVSFKVIITSSIVGLLAVFISIYNPARLASKVSPIEAMGNDSAVLKEGTTKKRKWHSLLNSLFGVTGKMAYQNLWRNKKRSVVTIFSMTLGCILFIVFSFINSSADFDNILDDHLHGDYSIMVNRGMEKYSVKDLESINNIEGIKEVKAIKFRGFGFNLMFNEENVNSDFLKYFKEEILKFPHYNQKKKNGQYLLESDVFGYDDKTLSKIDKYLEKGNIDIKRMKEKPLALFINSRVDPGYRVGDKIKFNVSLFDSDDGKYIRDKEIELEIGGILNFYPINMGIYSMGPGIVLHEDMFKDILEIDGYSRFDISIEPKIIREKIENKLEGITNKIPGGTFVDYEKEKKLLQKQKRQIKIMVISLIIVIGLIGFFNIVNTITTNLIIRTREFGMLRAIGITNKQLKKMVRLEGMFYGIVSAFWGSILGTILSFILYLLFKQEATYMKWNTPWISILGVCVGTIIVGVLATFIPLKRISSMNIVESIRNVE